MHPKLDHYRRERWFVDALVCDALTLSIRDQIINTMKESP